MKPAGGAGGGGGVGMHSSSSIVFDMCSKKRGAKSTFERFFFCQSYKNANIGGYRMNY